VRIEAVALARSRQEPNRSQHRVVLNSTYERKRLHPTGATSGSTRRTMAVDFRTANLHDNARKVPYPARVRLKRSSERCVSQKCRCECVDHDVLREVGPCHGSRVHSAPRIWHCGVANAPGIAAIPDAWGLGRHIDTQSPWH
jgi:hypothetical protein